MKSWKVIPILHFIINVFHLDVEKIMLRIPIILLYILIIYALIEHISENYFM